MSRIGVAFLDVVEYFGPPEGRPSTPGEVQRAIRAHFSGRYFANGGYLAESARQALDEGHADAVIFGATFLANPDLPERFRRAAPLNEARRAAFFGGGAEGYTDYPTLEG